MATHCRICNRELTDPTSIHLGIGPVCRMEAKQASLKSKPINMFASRSEYDFDTTLDGVLWLRDLQGMKSLTNDIEEALADIQKLGIDISQHLIIYCDSDGIWDQVIVNSTNPIQISFQHLGKNSLAAAKEKVLSNNQKQ